MTNIGLLTIAAGRARQHELEERKKAEESFRAATILETTALASEQHHHVLTQIRRAVRLRELGIEALIAAYASRCNAERLEAIIVDGDEDLARAAVRAVAC